MEDIIENQKSLFGINDFLNTAKKYTIEAFPNIDFNNILKDSISGKIDTNFFKIALNKILRRRNKTCNKLNGKCFNNNYYT